ncbi:MAG: hypothetical protein JO261_13720 [Alphaproteobacteria bacterium]|nr:hypothetical protein [Alphaproteobacteria bacterium]MBV9694751.1 hypothetical protein [Alphaproteobacteria bacterium]
MQIAAANVLAAQHSVQKPAAAKPFEPLDFRQAPDVKPAAARAAAGVSGRPPRPGSTLDIRI